jgi:diguanylate cyclase (GGDEF)-like protein
MMSLKSKIIIILLSIFLIYGFIEYSIQHFIIFPSFLKLEKYEAMQNLKRSIAAIDREIYHLDLKCKDWTVWDDTYDFVQSHSKRFITSNLNRETFTTNGLNAIFFCDTTGHTVWGNIVDLNTGKEIEMRDLFPNSSGKDYPLIKPENADKPLSDIHLSGILMTGLGPMLISSRPILTSENKGPSRGYAIFGQFLTENIIENLVKQTQVNFTIITDNALIKSAIRSASEQLDQNYSFAIDRAEENQLHIYTVYHDIQRKPAFLIRTTIPRTIVQNGFATIRFALLSVFIVGLGIMIIIILIMKRTIITPISRLTDHVLSLAETQNYSMRLKLNRSDEVGILAREFDKMVEKIEDQTKNLIFMNDDLIQDISKRVELERSLQQANRELDNLARIDGLTEIANRRRFDECLNIEWKRTMREKQPLSLIICDVDFFKLFNDTYGHQAGDECLKAIAQLIKNSTRRPSDFSARYGGEEFAVILPNTDSKGAANIAELIRSGVQSLGILHLSSSVAHCVTLSLGISCLIPDDSLSVEDLIDIADRALYEAKNQGRNCLVLRAPIESI